MASPVDLLVLELECKPSKRIVDFGAYLGLRGPVEDTISRSPKSTWKGSSIAVGVWPVCVPEMVWVIGLFCTSKMVWVGKGFHP